MYLWAVPKIDPMEPQASRELRERFDDELAKPWKDAGEPDDPVADEQALADEEMRLFDRAAGLTS